MVSKMLSSSRDHNKFQQKGLYLAHAVTKDYSVAQQLDPLKILERERARKILSSNSGESLQGKNQTRAITHLQRVAVTNEAA